MLVISRGKELFNHRDRAIVENHLSITRLCSAPTQHANVEKALRLARRYTIKVMIHYLQLGQRNLSR